MPRGVPKNGFRKTKNWLSANSDGSATVTQVSTALPKKRGRPSKADLAARMAALGASPETANTVSTSVSDTPVKPIAYSVPVPKVTISKNTTSGPFVLLGVDDASAPVIVKTWETFPSNNDLVVAWMDYPNRTFRKPVFMVASVMQPNW